MKMLLSSLILLSGLPFATVACSHAEETANTEEPTPTPETEPQPGNGRTLVVYFSCTNTTKCIAEEMSQIAALDRNEKHDWY
jgi:hypothetical protein